MSNMHGLSNKIRKSFTDCLCTNVYNIELCVLSFNDVYIFENISLTNSQSIEKAIYPSNSKMILLSFK